MLIKKIKFFLKTSNLVSAGRNFHVDALKGMLIIFVVFGHTIQINHPLHDNSYWYLTLSSFAMPLFMLLSGYIVSTQMRNTFLEYLRKYALRLLVPFFVWAAVSYIFYAHYQNTNLIYYLFSVARTPGNGLWFLWALFLCSIFLFAVLKLIQFKNWGHWENHIIIASIVLSRLANTDFFGLNEFKTYYTYYAVGYFVCKYYETVKAHRKIFYAFSVIAFPLLLMSFQRTGLPTFYSPLADFIGSAGIARFLVSIYKYVLAFAGMALLSFLLELVRKTRFYRFTCWVGMFTLDIYVCHIYFIVKWGDSIGQFFLVAVLAFICSIALTLLLLKRFKITRLLFLGENR